MTDSQIIPPKWGQGDLTIPAPLLSRGCTPGHHAGSRPRGGTHPHALPTAPSSPRPTTQQPLRWQKLSGCDQYRYFFFSLAKQLAGRWGLARGWGGGWFIPGKKPGVMSSPPKPSLPTQSSHLIPVLPVRRNEATATAEPLGFTAGVFAQVLF